MRLMMRSESWTSAKLFSTNQNHPRSQNLFGKWFITQLWSRFYVLTIGDEIFGNSKNSWYGQPARLAVSSKPHKGRYKYGHRFPARSNITSTSHGDDIREHNNTHNTCIRTWMSRFITLISSTHSSRCSETGKLIERRWSKSSIRTTMDFWTCISSLWWSLPKSFRPRGR